MRTNIEHLNYLTLGTPVQEVGVLTQRQRQLLQFIEQFMQTHGVSPSFEEMRGALNLRSKSGIHRLISGLEERGHLRRLAYRARALEIVRPAHEASTDPKRTTPAAVAMAAAAPGSNIVQGPFRRRAPPRPELLLGSSGTIELPLYGRIAAGTPIEALAEGGATMEVPSGLVGEGEHYVLQVVGDSMIDAGIFDGDMVVIQRGETADNGQIVVALIDDREVTLKRLRRRGASIALEAANQAYETRIYGPQQIKVQGRLVGLLRRY